MSAQDPVFARGCLPFVDDNEIMWAMLNICGSRRHDHDNAAANAKGFWTRSTVCRTVKFAFSV